MYVCESSDVINLNNKTHSLMLAGTYLGYVPVSFLNEEANINNSSIAFIECCYWFPTRKRMCDGS